MNAVARRGVQALLVVLLTGVSTLLLAVAVVPLVLGWVSLAVPSGAADPALPPGSRVVVEPLRGEDDAARLAVGDVVAYVPGDGTLATHRISEVVHDAHGAPRFGTGADDGPGAGEEAVTAGQVRGVVRYHVPWAGHPGTLLDAEQKRAGTVLVAAALLGYALRQAAGAVPGGRPDTAAAIGQVDDVPGPRTPSVAAAAPRQDRRPAALPGRAVQAIMGP